jgi:adenine phosphoribosyltransferase
MADRRSGEDLEALLGSLVRDVVDYPAPGVVFKDITPLMADARALAGAVAALAAPFAGRVDMVAAIEARGFLLAAPVAVALGAGVVPLRKLGKLPWSTMSESYDLEYGSDSLEVHLDAVGEGDRVLVVDDIVATGGTARAAVDLVRRAGASVVGLTALLEIVALGGRARLAEAVPELHVLISV